MAGQILITGASGLVGSRFIELFPDRGLLLTPDEQEFNFLCPQTLKAYFTHHQPSVIINFAAFTDVNEAQKQSGDRSGLCWQINVLGVERLLSFIDLHKTQFIQISTDMIFSGSAADPGPYPENHTAESDDSLLNWYGNTKSQAEKLIMDSGVIVRICNPVRSEFSQKLDYFRKCISLAKKGQLYPLFTNQYLTITYIDEVAQALQEIIKYNLRGIYHVSSSDSVTPYGVISQLFSRLGLDISQLNMAELTDLVRYPKFTGLKCKFTQKKLGLKFKNTSEIISDLISQGLSG